MPEHFLAGFPVAEYMLPDHSRFAGFLQAGHCTSSSLDFTSSSNCFPHAGHLYCKRGMTLLYTVAAKKSTIFQMTQRPSVNESNRPSTFAPARSKHEMRSAVVAVLPQKPS